MSDQDDAGTGRRETVIRLIVAGSRTIKDEDVVSNAIDQHLRGRIFDPDEVEIVHGGAEGVDSIAAEFADERGLKERVFEPAWDEHGPAAGPIRNAEMAEYADELVAVWDGESSGTEDIIEKSRSERLDHFVVMVGGGADE